MPDIRLANIDDAEDLNSIDQDIFGRKNYSNYGFLIKLDTSLIEVAEINGEIVGYAYFSCTEEEAELYHIGVKRNFRRRNIGFALINTSLEVLKKRGVKKIFLEVREDNFNAVKLYEKIGFKFYKYRRDYYDMGIGAKCYLLEVE